MMNIRLVYLPPPPVPKSRGIAIALALIFGSFGLHRFYLEKPWTGLLYLIFAWTFIPLILGIFEGLNYLSMDITFFRYTYTIGLKEYNEDLMDLNDNKLFFS